MKINQKRPRHSQGLYHHIYNTFFKDTIRRNEELANSGINFIGTGVSGGEEGALKGPSIMPGGQKEAYELVAPILEQISAKAEDGAPCVTFHLHSIELLTIASIKYSMLFSLLLFLIQFP